MQYENKIAITDSKVKFRSINPQEIKIICKELNKKNQITIE